MRIAIKPFVGLEVVIPKRFPKYRIPHILQQNEAWIVRQLAKHADSFIPPSLPDSVHIQLSDETFFIAYKKGVKASHQQHGNKLLILHTTEEQAIQVLRRWFRQKARTMLEPILQQSAQETGLKYHRISVRSQKSRWGSCSARGTISLNDQLLFMPAATVRYLMIHELCHTKHMNHSKRYWQLVESHCTDFRLHENTLNKGRECIPAWFLKSLYR